ncbi:MAG: glycosyltransferase [Flavipsychrobacter sp.]
MFNSLCFFAAMLAEIIFIVFLIGVLIQLGYLLSIFAHFFSLPANKPITTAAVPVSIIICAKNEADNLRRYLPKILAQRYKNDVGNSLFEVIVVNDASVDDTQEVLQALKEQYHLLNIVTITDADNRDKPGKKYALSRGVAAAQHDVLLMTDADCEPLSESWLSYMVAPIVAEQKDIVLGYGKYRSVKGWLNAFIRWETLHTFVQYSSYAILGMPYMGVGRNIACTKSVLLKAQQSPKWNKTASGDDDMLVQLAGEKDNVKVVYAKEAHTVSTPKEHYADWKHQKQRHFSTGKLYNNRSKLLLGLYGITHGLMWLLFIALLFTPYRNVAYIVMGARCIAYWVFWSYAANKLEEQAIIKNIIPTDFGWALYNFVFSPYIIWKTKQTWK